MNPVCRNKKTGELYLYKGDGMFKNIRTGTEGVIETELAQKILSVNVEATQMLNEYPILQEAINRLNLVMEYKPQITKS